MGLFRSPPEPTPMVYFGALFHIASRNVLPGFDGSYYKRSAFRKIRFGRLSLVSKNYNKRTSEALCSSDLTPIYGQVATSHSSRAIFSSMPSTDMSSFGSACTTFRTVPKCFNKARARFGPTSGIEPTIRTACRLRSNRGFRFRQGKRSSELRNSCSAASSINAAVSSTSFEKSTGSCNPEAIITSAPFIARSCIRDFTCPKSPSIISRLALAAFFIRMSCSNNVEQTSP